VSLKRIGLVVLGVFALGCLSTGVVWFLFPALRLTLWEQVTGNRPEAVVQSYARAVLQGDEEAALALWEIPTWEFADGRRPSLADRREAETRALAVANLQPDFTILHVEWWRTCCEPGVTCHPEGAGGARVQVQFVDQEGHPVRRVFDVFHRDGPYWGGPMNYPARHWALRDVYAPEQEPLFWRWVYEPAVRHLPWPP